MSRLSWLLRETKKWVSSGIITVDQADQITALYPAENKNRLISVLLLLGAILLGTGIILFFAANWRLIPAWGKISLVIVPLILFHLAAHLTSANYPRLSQALTLLGCVMFGSGIWLVAQIFHISAHFPNGMLFWLLGVLPVAFFLKEELPLGLSALLLASWTLSEQSSSLLIMFVAMMLFAGVFYLTYTLRSSFALVVTLISVAVFVNTEIYQILADNYQFTAAGSLIPFVLLLVGSSYVYMSKHPVNGDNKDFPFIYKFFGVTLVGVSLFIMSLEFFADDFIKLRQSGAGYFLFWALYIAVAFLGAYAISRHSVNIKEIIRENYPWLAVDALVFFILLVPFKALTLMIILNLFMFIWALLVIISAYQTQSGLYFILGMIAFNVYVLEEYFNFFWESLDKSLFFIAGGIVLVLSGALMERQRRKAVLAWQQEGGDSHEEEL